MTLGNPLRGERIIVRSCMQSDLPFSTEMWFDPDNGHYLSDPTVEFVDEVYQKALDGLQDSAYGYYFIVELRCSGERIGTCCVFPDKDRRVYDIGYCIHRSHWRQGFGTELVELIANWIREQGGSAVTAETARENRGSRALLEKCGFTVKKESSFKKYNMDISFDSLIYEKKLYSQRS